MKITLAESAVRDLEALIEYCATEGFPKTGRRLVSELLARIESLTDHPKLGRIVPEFETESLRELIHPPFRIVYRLSSDRIQVIRVWRGERELKLE